MPGVHPLQVYRAQLPLSSVVSVAYNNSWGGMMAMVVETVSHGAVKDWGQLEPATTEVYVSPNFVVRSTGRLEDGAMAVNMIPLGLPSPIVASRKR